MTDRNTIVQAAAAMDSALGEPMIGMHADVAIADTPHGPCDLNAVHKAYALLDQIARRASHVARRRSNRIRFRATLGGRDVGTTSMGAIVQEENRVKFYGLGLIVPEDMVSQAEPMTSRCGTHYGVRIHTPDGALDLTTAPGTKGRRPVQTRIAR